MKNQFLIRFAQNAAISFCLAVLFTLVLSVIIGGN